MITSAQFYFYGRSRFTAGGWESAVARYNKGGKKKDILGVVGGQRQMPRNPALDLSGRVYIVTGANSGVGYQIAKYLAIHGARVHMVCRNKTKAEKARAEIVAAGLVRTKKDRMDDVDEKSSSSASASTKTSSDSEGAAVPDVRVLIGDVSLERDVRRVWGEFASESSKTYGSPRLDGLVCNAGALLNRLTVTDEGAEVTFASHLLFGTYLLGSLSLAALRASPTGGRFIAVSSGGMYNTKWPGIEDASWISGREDTYDGQYSYACAKRGQVLLCERWAEAEKAKQTQSSKGDLGKIKFVSCHPGWTATPGVDKAYGDKKKYLGDMRSPWQGAEGIVWLCVAPMSEIEGGAFYLDRSPRRKHISGPFFTEGWHTQNDRASVDKMMSDLDAWCDAKKRPGVKRAGRTKGSHEGSKTEGGSKMGA